MPETYKNLWGGEGMRKERKQWAPGAAVLSEKWQNGCATRSGGHRDPHSRAAQTGGQDQTVSQAQGREATQTRSLLSRGSLSTATCVSTALGSPSNHMADTPRTGWREGLVPDMAGGSSRKEHESKHSLYLAQWPGQTASQM